MFPTRHQKIDIQNTNIMKGNDQDWYRTAVMEEIIKPFVCDILQNRIVCIISSGIVYHIIMYINPATFGE